MAEYIEREAAKLRIFEYGVRHRYDGSIASACENLERQMNSIPAADVVSAGAYEQTAWERDTAIAQLAEIGKAFGETMDDAIEERKFYEFLWNTIQPNEMEQYISMYRAQGVPSDASREES